MKQAKWIWCQQNKSRDYNQAVFFRKEFSVVDADEACLSITADSWYRVSVNGKWINDGPSRAYPEHIQHDELDVTPALKAGKNRIEVIVRYFGCGTFHQIPQQAGLLAQLRYKDSNDWKTIGTDSTWQATPSKAWKQWVPKISIQMEPVEEYDARLGKVLDWQPAIEIHRSIKTTPRNTGLLTKKPRRFKKLHSARVVKKTVPQICVPVVQLAHGNPVEANYYTSRPLMLASVLTVRKKQPFDFFSKDWKVSVNGRMLKTGKITLSAGRHAVLFFCAEFYGHHNRFPSFPFLQQKNASWGQWHVGLIEELLFRGDDMTWMCFENKEARQIERRYFDAIEEISKGWKKPDQKLPTAVQWRNLPEELIFMDDFSAEFKVRSPLASAIELIDGAAVKPSATGDVELCYDFGEETCGYVDFVIQAKAGVVIDFNGVEYISPDGAVQYTESNRNGLRYITQDGTNRFTSLKRRAARYLFVTLRNQNAPVEIKSLRIIESTAPVEAVGSFHCSDPVLNRIWQISEHTLKLCMEDTFTDCPLYEQTLWIGDARNEALYAFTAYGNFDISARSLELGAQSLERYPMVGCQVPSSWDCLLPAWSFLWGMHVWEHYFYSGDKRFLKKMWPAVLKNLDGAEQFIDRNGLFSMQAWNLIEWAPIDQDHATVLHNSMLLVGALHAAEQCAEELSEPVMRKQLCARRKKLIAAINRTWDEQKNSYPDAILENGQSSAKTCQHTSMLALMCDIAGSKVRSPALNNLLNPPRGMTPVCSPFAMQFMYEALEKTGELDALLSSMREKFQPMIDAGATTVWETFAGSTMDVDTGIFPTRSHCHAWASSPIYFLNRIVLGIRPTQSGGKAFEISPWIRGLRSARGVTATPAGAIRVEWKQIGEILEVLIVAPKGVRTVFKSNASHAEVEVRLTYA